MKGALVLFKYNQLSIAIKSLSLEEVRELFRKVQVMIKRLNKIYKLNKPIRLHDTSIPEYDEAVKMVHDLKQISLRIEARIARDENRSQLVRIPDLSIAA